MVQKDDVFFSAADVLVFLGVCRLFGDNHKKGHQSVHSFIYGRQGQLKVVHLFGIGATVTGVRNPEPLGHNGLSPAEGPGPKT